MIDVVCVNCDKRFKVRPEFAGRKTRCPGCSANIDIGGHSSPAPAKRPKTEEPRAKPRPVDDDERPRRPGLDWSSAATAFRREQIALMFALVSIFTSFASYCMGQMSRSGMDDPGMLGLVIVLGFGPPIVTVALGIAARVAALGVPIESHARGSAWASLICSLAGLMCLIVLGLSVAIGVGGFAGDPLPLQVGTVALVVSALASLFTFFAFTAQVGILRRSGAVSRGVGRTSLAAMTSFLGLLFIAGIYTVGFGTRPTYRNSYRNEHDGFYGLMFGVAMPLGLGLILVLYHRLLAAARTDLVGPSPSRYQD